jgi:hypothetical protein
MDNSFNNTGKDPLVEAAARVLRGDVSLNEGAEEVQAIAKAVEGFKVGDKTNFGTVVEIGSGSITFKAKDLPKTTIPFNHRKMGSKDYSLSALRMMEGSYEDKQGTMEEEEETIEEALVRAPFKFAGKSNKFLGKGTKDEELGSELTQFIGLTTKRQPLLGKYLEVKHQTNFARGRCVGFCTFHGTPYLILEDGNGESILIACSNTQREIYEFTPTGGEVTGVKGTGSSDNPALYSMSKKNY